jgi:hypothetical protein
VGVVHVGGSDNPTDSIHQHHTTGVHPHALAWAAVMGCFGRSASKSDAEESKRRKEANKKINQQIQKDKQVYRATHRLLLLGKTTNHLANWQIKSSHFSLPAPHLTNQWHLFFVLFCGPHLLVVVSK